MVEVRVVPDSPSALLFMIGTVLLITPFTVVLSVLALEVLLIEFTIGTVLPVTPLTVVLIVFALDVLLTPETAGDVAATPLTVDVSVLVDRDSELLAPIDDGLTQLALPLASL